MQGEDDREDRSTEAAEGSGPPAAAPSQGNDGPRRTDAAGYDVTPPPAPPQPAGQNPGLATETPPERMDFREFGTGAEWTDDAPAPDRLEADANPAAAEGVSRPLGDDPGETPFLDIGSDGGDDLIEAVARAIEEVELLDLWDVSVETRGDTVILRGSAATPQDRDRAAELAGGVSGVARVENLISAGPAHGA